jgi:hypothetical protein
LSATPRRVLKVRYVYTDPTPNPYPVDGEGL